MSYTVSLHYTRGQAPFFSSLVSKKSKTGGKDQESIQSSIKPDPGYHMGK